jgi:TRAP transporter TAXI family solute receptor
LHAQTDISIGVSDAGGSFYPIAVGMSQVLSQHVPSLRSTVVTTGGSLASIRQLTAGEIDVGFGTFSAGVGAYHGTGLFADDAPDPTLRYFSPLFTSFGFFISLRPDYPDLHALKGTRIAMGEVGSSVAVLAEAILKGTGLEKGTDYEAHELGGSDALNALRERRVDVAFIGATPGQATIEEVTTTDDVSFIAYPPDRFEAIVAALAAADLARPLLPVRAGTFRGMDSDYMASAGTTAAFVSTSLDEELVYQMTKAWWDNISEVAEIHPLGRSLDIEIVKEHAGEMPIHPGALRYYVERGVIEADPYQP